MPCSCHTFSDSVQGSLGPGQHAIAWASDLAPGLDILKAHMQDEFIPGWRQYMHKATEYFEKWLQCWLLPPYLMIWWQAELREQWDRWMSSPQPKWDFRHVFHARQKLREVVVASADHHPHSLLAMCSTHFQFLLQRTFGDRDVFKPGLNGPGLVLRNIRSELSSCFLQKFRWGLRWDSTLPSAYIFPKPNRFFQKARPIVAYTQAWCSGFHHRGTAP